VRHGQHARFIYFAVALAQPNHHIGSFPRHSFGNRIPDGLFSTKDNDLLSSKIEDYESDAARRRRSRCPIEKLPSHIVSSLAAPDLGQQVCQGRSRLGHDRVVPEVF
jgi:hypothetical protein